MVAIPKWQHEDDRDKRRQAPAAVTTDRMPPWNLEAEQGVLGSILLDNDTLHEIVPILKASHFYRDTHQQIYSAIREMYLDARPVDMVTLEAELGRLGIAEKVGGMSALMELQNSVPHAVNAKYYAQIVVQNATKRDLIDMANEALQSGYSRETTAEELLEEVERRVFAIAEDQVTGDTVPLIDALQEAMSRIDQRQRGILVGGGLSTGFEAVDALTGPMSPGQEIVLAARPSMGKTAFALNICDHVAMAHGKPVLFVSLEMGKVEIAERLLCIRSGVDGAKIRTGKGITQEDMRQLTLAYEAIRESGKIYIDDTPARTVSQITANARRLKMRHEIGMVVIDYIQLITPEDGRDSRQEQVAKISRRLKTLARDLDVPVVVLSQLNRAVETREDHRPRMADLRESGAIEQDADMVLLLHRPEYYDPNDSPGIAEVIVAKNRNGATGTANTIFRKQTASFHEVAPVQYHDYDGPPM